MRRPRGAVAAMAPLCALVLLVGAAPFVAAVVDSFFHDVYGERAPAGLENYRTIFTDRGMGMSLGITVAWAVAHALFSLTLAVPVAARIARARRRSTILYAALLVAWAMPASMGAALWRALVHGGFGMSLLSAVARARLDLLSNVGWALAATLAASVWMALPLTVFLIVAAMAATPSTLQEAATIDGATRTQVDLWIRLPAAAAAVYTAGLLDLLRAFREITVILVMTRGGPPLPGGVAAGVGATTTIEVYLYGMFSRTPDTGQTAAAALLVAALVTALLAGVLAAQRRTARGDARPRLRFPLVGSCWGAWSWTASLLVAGCCAMLLYSLLRLSFSNLSAVFFDTLLPRFPTANNYPSVLVDHGLLRALLNTLVLALPTSLLLVAVSFPAAATLWSPAGWAGGPAHRAGSDALVLAVQLLGLVTGMHALVPLYVLFRGLGLIGSYLPVILIYAAHGLPFALLALRAALGALPASLADAARLEGMSTRLYGMRVLLPLMGPTLVVIGGVAFLDAWNGFLVPLVFLTDDARYPVALKLYSLVGSIGSANPRWNLFAAGSVIDLVVVGALALWLRRPMVRTALSEHAE